MRLLTVLFLVGALLHLGALEGASAEEAPLQIAGAHTVDAEQVIALIDRTPGLVIIDSRKAEDFAAGAIEGAILLTDTDMTERKLFKIAPNRSKPILFYCNGVKCGRAAKAVSKAVEWGYKEVYYYALGMAEWEKRGLPMVRH
jgi:rhodanese-related sulfurtransferase